MTKVIIKKNRLNNDSRDFLQIFWMSADGSVESNYDASRDQVVAVSNVAKLAGLDMKFEVKSFDGGQEIIEIWE